MKYYVHYKATPEAPKNLLKYDGARAGFVTAKNDVSAQAKADRWAASTGERADSFTRNGFVVVAVRAA